MGWKVSHLTAINTVRLWMGAMTLADMATLNGKEITERVMQMEPGGKQRRGWPRVFEPITRQKTEWRKLMRALCGEGRQLRGPLGEWQDDVIFHDWEWVSNKNRTKAYQRSKKIDWGKCTDCDSQHSQQEQVQSMKQPEWKSRSRCHTILCQSV